MSPSLRDVKHTSSSVRGTSLSTARRIYDILVLARDFCSHGDSWSRSAVGSEAAALRVATLQTVSQRAVDTAGCVSESSEPRVNSSFCEPHPLSQGELVGDWSAKRELRVPNKTGTLTSLRGCEMATSTAVWQHLWRVSSIFPQSNVCSGEHGMASVGPQIGKHNCEGGTTMQKK